VIVSMIDRLRLERVARLMDRAIEDSLVSGFELLEMALSSLPDPHDRHVLAAAIHCYADEIVTFNVRDFPDAVLNPHGIRAVHPDTFIERLIYAKPAVVCDVIRTVRRRRVNPARSAEEMLRELRAARTGQDCHNAQVAAGRTLKELTGV